MGLFDKKKKRANDFDSPVEEIDLSALAATPEAMDVFEDELEADAPTQVRPAGDAIQAPRPSPTPSPTPAAAPQRPARRTAPPAYGIDQAIALMRTLPMDNVELVVQVVKHTLASTAIAIPPIIEDAAQKQQRIENRIAHLRKEIASLEQEIATRRKEIKGLEEDHRETSKVKERLILAEKLTNPEDPKPKKAAKSESKPAKPESKPAREAADAAKQAKSAAARPKQATNPPPTPEPDKAKKEE
jgi:cell division protein FtsB